MCLVGRLGLLGPRGRTAALPTTGAHLTLPPPAAGPRDSGLRLYPHRSRRPGLPSCRTGIWPWSYDTCDANALQQQNWTDHHGQRINRCNDTQGTNRAAAPPVLADTAYGPLVDLFRYASISLLFRLLLDSVS